MPEREDMIRSGSLAFRRRLPPMVEPSYSMSTVQRAHRDLIGSEFVRVDGRIDWLPYLAEMLLLCNEASRRQFGRGLSLTGNKPLSLEYLADRLDTDDPLWGYTIRTSPEVDPTRQMQGFITLTTFTTWVRWFRWDSSAEVAAIDEFPKDLPKTGRVVDTSNELASMLEATVRDGDPEGEGVIWPHIAEISLLGGLGCGKALLQLAIEELEAFDSPYDFVVLQATENAVAFYESQGFTRVGAAARYQDLDPELMERKRQAERAEMLSSVSREIITILDHLEGVQEGEQEASEAVESDISCFSELPPKTLAGYYSIIKNPISFAEIRAKAKDLKYESLLGLSGVERDLKLMCDNAKRFNAVGSAVWLAAEDLERSAMVKLDPNSGNTSFSSSEALDLVPLSHELLKASSPTAFWRKIKPDLLVDCQDSKRGHWLKSKVVQLDDLGRCLIHFQGWAKKWDEWYQLDSEHIAKAGTYTDHSEPVVDEIIPLQDEKAILKATAFRVKPSITLAVTAGVQPSSKRLGTLPSGMVVLVTDKHVNAKGMVERLFFEQATNSAVPAKGWVSLRRQAAKGGGMEMLLDPVKAKSTPLDTLSPPSPSKSNTRRRRGRNHSNNTDSTFEVKPMLGAGAVAGCTECCWHICRPDDTPTTIAAHVGCSPFDVVFLNKNLYIGLNTSSRMRGGTKLRVPVSKDVTKNLVEDASVKEKRWHDAKENETPRMIVAAHCPGVTVADFIAVNAKRFPDLQPSSRLRKGTRVRLPRARSEGASSDELYRESCLAWEDDPEVVAYRHWTFPDDESIEDTSASYMMARKLVRRKRGVNGETTQRILDCARKTGALGNGSVDVGNGTNRSRSMLSPQSMDAANQLEGAPVAVMEAVMAALKEMKDEVDNRRRCELFLELPPKKHFSDYYLLIKDPICLNQISKRIADTEAAKHRSRSSLSADSGYSTITEFSNDLQKLFDNARSYNLPGSEVYIDAEEMEVLARETLARLMGEHDAKGDLFNKVVSVSPAPDGSTLPYGLYFVLTYIPDLQWCRLGPLEKRGTFKKGSPYAGQPRWMLVHGEDAEADVSASRCSVVRARAAKRTEDADFEEWVIPESEKAKAKAVPQTKANVKATSTSSSTSVKSVSMLENPSSTKVDVRASPPASPTISSVASSPGNFQFASPLESIELYGGLEEVEHRPGVKPVVSRSLRKFDYVAKVSSYPVSVDTPSLKPTSDVVVVESSNKRSRTEVKKQDVNSSSAHNSKKRGRGRPKLQASDESEEESEEEVYIAKPSSRRKTSAASAPTSPKPKSIKSQDQKSTPKPKSQPETLEELLSNPPPRIVADQKQWGQSFIKVSMTVPAAVFGAEYAKSALSLWNIKELTCQVKKFKPGKTFSQHRWEFDWVDPESTTVGTVDFKNMSVYARKALEELNSCVARSRPKRKTM